MMEMLPKKTNRFTTLMEEITDEDNIILLFSGGIDSTFMLLKLLSENKYNHLYIHNISLEYYLGRASAEQMAVEKIMKLIDNTPEFVNYSFSQSKHDYTGCGNRFYVLDAEYYLFEAGLVAKDSHRKNINPINKLALGANKDDLEVERVQKTGNRCNKILDLCIDNLLHNNVCSVSVIRPIINYTKLEIINKLPYEYRKLTLSCRHPVLEEDIPTKCGECMTCKDMKTLGVFDD